MQDVESESILAALLRGSHYACEHCGAGIGVFESGGQLLAALATPPASAGKTPLYVEDLVALLERGSGDVPAGPCPGATQVVAYQPLLAALKGLLPGPRPRAR